MILREHRERESLCWKLQSSNWPTTLLKQSVKSLALLYFMTVVRCAILLITLDNGQAGAPIATFFYDRIFHRKITQLLFLSTFLGPLQIQTRVFISSWNKISCFADMFQSCLAKKEKGSSSEIINYPQISRSGIFELCVSSPATMLLKK